MSDPKPPLSYSAAGVDIDAKMGAVSRARGVIRSTFTKGVVGDVGANEGLVVGCAEGELVVVGNWLG